LRTQNKTVVFIRAQYMCFVRLYYKSASRAYGVCAPVYDVFAAAAKHVFDYVVSAHHGAEGIVGLALLLAAHNGGKMWQLLILYGKVDVIWLHNAPPAIILTNIYSKMQ
jgi:hypothetical protein